MTATNPATTPAAPPAAVPVDFTAVLAAMQDQLDDLAAVIETQQRRVDALERSRKD